MFDDCFNIEVGRFSIKLGLWSRVLFDFTGTGLIKTLEFLRTGNDDYEGLNKTEVFVPVGISLDDLTIYGGLVELAF